MPSKDDLDLISKSSFFDVNWYLSRYPDVKEAGVDPAEHYLMYGANERRNPGPNFDTNWYLKRNSDVAAAKINPLVHFLKFGAREGRGSSPFEMLKKKIDAAPGEITQLLTVYSSAETYKPERATDANHEEVLTQWQKYFLSKGAQAYFREELSKSLNYLASAIKVDPSDVQSYKMYSHVFRMFNQKEIEPFELAFADAKLLVAHISCQPKLQLAQRSACSFYNSSAGIKSVIIIGDPYLEYGRFSFDSELTILKVPASDVYEALPLKMSKLFLFLGLTSLDAPVLKIDDDIRCRDVRFLEKDLEQVISKHNYGGLVMPGGPFIGSTIWHLGKCTAPDMNEQPDGLIYSAPFAAGPCYWLGNKAINALSKISIIHEAYFRGELFEDRAIGAVLAHYDFRAHPFSLIDSGSLESVDCTLLNDSNIL